MFNRKHLVSVSREEIENKLKELDRYVEALKKELNIRGPSEEKKWGFPYSERTPQGLITRYAYYDSFNEALEAFKKEFPDVDNETAPYRIMEIYVGCNDTKIS